jgi:zinc protease
LKEAVTDRFEHGAIEIAMVGDFDEDAAIAMVARTFGALPQREAKFRTYTDNRDRDFTDDRSQRVIYHDGEADQAQINLAWPTRDDADLEEHLQLELLERVMRIELTDKLREELGQTYSPGVSASQSRTYPGYGTFTVSAAIDVKDVDATRAAIEETVAALIAAPVDDDVLLRARQPLVESYDNALKTNSGWMGLVDRAQSQPERITRYNIGKQTLSAITAEDIQAAAERYLGSGMALEILALPRPEAEVSAE